ncbi:TPA: TerB family tellurite resistance protein [Vibrio parahaemolyticus]|uniref:tellurite resistance TerB family protein n=1 Tax=Vibrio parahaemolyticus TaxID=670 RepID=UPI001E619831|nr:TerB family tellurite resistance protein [Vibrio parahaemolyticus]HCE2668638.1 TerB family tellurite resistance protein [Vibrio parahaemolyticus]HCE4613063.1 TerB family tellurite resistance protein [Vibrio parahaemolyticus]HCG8762386.1 TerB family tellurite resistance protein [Vibrio parahaemolyticus]
MLDILDVINEATKEANSFENHAAKDLTLEERLLYLQGLALVMNADGEIHPEEKEYIRILIKSFEMDESILESSVEFAQRPDKDTVQAFFRTFRRRPIAQLFLFDALMMTRRDDSVNEREKAVVDKIAEQLEVRKGTYRDIFDLFCHIKNKDWEDSALYFSSHLLSKSSFAHLLDYYDVDYDDLVSRTERLRTKRLLAIFMDRLQKPSERTELKIEINNEIILPIIQASIDRGDVSVFMNTITLLNGEEVELSETGFCFDQENKELYIEKEVYITNKHLIMLVSSILNIDILELCEVIFGRDNIVFGEISEDSNDKVILKSKYEKGKLISIGGKLFEYIHEGEGIFGKTEIYSNPEMLDFDACINHGETNQKFLSGKDGDIEIYCDYCDFFCNGIAGMLKELKISNIF